MRLDYENYSIQPSKIAMREQLARDMQRAAIPITVIPSPPLKPLRETQRKCHPEWEAARIKREKASAKKPLYSQREVMDIFDCSCIAEGYAKFDRMIARGEIPQPDWTKNLGRGRETKRWLRTSLDKFLEMRGLG